MSLKRLKRIFLGTILPIYIGPVWATLITFVLLLFWALGEAVPEAGGGLLGAVFMFSLAAAHMVLPIPAIICSFLMEYVINPMTKSSPFTIVLGGMMGLITAFSVEYFHDLSGKEFLFPELLIGLLTGLTVAWILRRDYVKHGA